MLILVEEREKEKERRGILGNGAPRLHRGLTRQRGRERRGDADTDLGRDESETSIDIFFSSLFLLH